VSTVSTTPNSVRIRGANPRRVRGGAQIHSKSPALDRLRRALPADALAAETLRAAGGTCARCQGHGLSLLAVKTNTGWSAQCLDLDGCERRLAGGTRSERATYERAGTDLRHNRKENR
jgi:hypothetical protein